MRTMRRFACPRLEMLEDRLVPSGGQLDPSFGGDGTVTVAESYQAAAHEVLIQPDGKIVLVGWTASGSSVAKPTLACLTSDGHPDPTFGTVGVVTVEIPDTTGEFTGAARTANGGIVATGVIRVPLQGQASSLMIAPVPGRRPPGPGIRRRGRLGFNPFSWGSCTVCDARPGVRAFRRSRRRRAAAAALRGRLACPTVHRERRSRPELFR